ncbi:MAG: nickel pincer cofactor biosynthesis protein LarB [Pseudomonadota bacterium]
MTDISKEITLDLKRQSRLGFDEAIFCAQKSPPQIDEILQQARAQDRPLLLTRLSPAGWDALAPAWAGAMDYDPVSQTAFLNAPARAASRGEIAVVSAGTSDIPAAKEAVRTLHYYGHEPAEIYDVGVAGLWRLLDRVDDLKERRVIIAVAGMDAALPSVLGGLVGGLIIAVPTSTGYGVAEGGATALKSALSSCAPGVLVCNIDNGYGAACAAIRAHNAYSGGAT